MIGIEAALLIGGLVGAVTGLVPRAKIGCAALVIIPLVMLVCTFTQQNDASRRPDALDPLFYVFNPLWPSLGALIGFGLVRLLRAMVLPKARNGR